MACSVKTYLVPAQALDATPAQRNKKSLAVQCAATASEISECHQIYMVGAKLIERRGPLQRFDQTEIPP